MFVPINCQGLSGSSAGSNNCNGSNSQPVAHRSSMSCEVKIPSRKGAKNIDEYLVTKRRNGGSNCHSDDRGDSEIGKGSLEAQYFENQNSSWSKGAEHGFGNAKRHVLLSLVSHLVLTFCFP